MEPQPNITFDLDLSDRVSRLERQNRNLRHGLGVVLVIGGFAGTLGATLAQSRPATQPNNVIEANQIILRDEDGKARITLVASKGLTAISLTGRDELPQIELMSVRDGAVITMADTRGRPRIEFQAESLGGPTATLYDENHKVRVALGARPSGPTINLLSRNEKPRITLNGGGEETSMGLFDDHDIPRMSLVVNDGGSGLNVYDKSHHIRAMLADETKTGLVALSLFDFKEHPRIELGTTRDRQNLFFMDDKGKSTWKAP